MAIWVVQVHSVVTGRSRVWNSFFIEIHEASGSRHGHGQWGAVLFLTLWPQGLGPDLTASNIRVGYRHVARDREIGTFWIAIFCKNNLWVQRMALKSHFRARRDASPASSNPPK